MTGDFTMFGKFFFLRLRFDLIESRNRNKPRDMPEEVESQEYSGLLNFNVILKKLLRRVLYTAEM